MPPRPADGALAAAGASPGALAVCGHRVDAGAAALRRARRAGVGQRTCLAQPNFSKAQMTRADMSICPGWPR
jgi:hypothetical protein